MTIEIDVSVVITAYNAAEWLEEALESLLLQTESFGGKLEVSIFNDASSDATADMLREWQKKFEGVGMRTIISENKTGLPKGVGYGRNRAIEQSTGRYLCFFDADDIMAPDRIKMQYDAAIANPNALIGSRFVRVPPDSTHRYTKWCNELTQAQLHHQAYTAFGPTLIQPTWFCSRDVFMKAGEFSEQGKGTAEDLMFFYKHLSGGGQLVRLDKHLLTYRYHQDCQSFGVRRETIWELRVRALQENVLSRWSHFTIWNAGKQGRRLYRSLTPQNRAKVVAFCDVDKKKIELGFYTYEESSERPKPRVPIIHFTAATAPFILCVKLELTNGEFEKNLASLKLQEGVDYYHFS